MTELEVTTELILKAGISIPECLNMLEHVRLGLLQFHRKGSTVFLIRNNTYPWTRQVHLLPNANVWEVVSGVKELAVELFKDPTILRLEAETANKKLCAVLRKNKWYFDCIRHEAHLNEENKLVDLYMYSLRRT
jgi:hypothetical protein